MFMKRRLRQTHAWAAWLAFCCATMLAGVSDVARAAEASGDSTHAGLALKRSEKWSPDPVATPTVIPAANGSIAIRGNGTRTCCGGWQYVFSGVQPGQAYRIRVRVQHKDLAHARDSLAPMLAWTDWAASETRTGHKPWNYLTPKPVSPEQMEFEAVAVAPEGATALTVRYTFRWSQHGASEWTPPQIALTSAPVRSPVKVCVLSASKRAVQPTKVEPFSRDLGLPNDVAQSVDLWASLVQAACRRKPQLIVTPEWAVGGEKLIEGAVEVPGPATRPFEQLARQHQTHLALGVRQRDGDAIYNSLAVIGPDGKIVGVYHKVHLATSEGLSGASPGNSFPVFDTAIGRIGCLICMDTTVCESARMLALNGADIICFSIMGDLRADRFSAGPPIFNEDRWKAIMRTRAIDNQLCMAVARNGAQGSCIIDRKGDILAWNEGDREIIEATLPADDGYRIWDGGDFREVTHLLRRPHLYNGYSDESNLLPLGSRAPRPDKPNE